MELRWSLQIRACSKVTCRIDIGFEKLDWSKQGTLLSCSRKVKVVSLPKTIKEKSTFRAKALRRELVVGVGENHACLYTS